MDDGAATPRWETWSPADVSRWVADTLELPQYADAFTVHDVDGPTLLELTEEMLEDPLGIVEALKRKKIMGHIKLLKIRNMPLPQDATQGSLPSRHRRRLPGSDGANTPRQASATVRPATAPQASRVRRNRSGGSVGTKTPRSVSAGSERSLECSGSISMKSLGEEGSLYSDYTNPNQRITAGLVSNFGIDSPSFSRTGSFQRTPRKNVFPGVPPNSNHYPGPDCYQIGRDSVDRVLRASPRATIGRSPRNTVEYVVPISQAPGVGKYNNAPAIRSKGHTFPTSPRLNYSGHQVRNWLSPRRGPGPADYRPLRGYDSTFNHT